MPASHVLAAVLAIVVVWPPVTDVAGATDVKEDIVMMTMMMMGSGETSVLALRVWTDDQVSSHPSAGGGA